MKKFLYFFITFILLIKYADAKSYRIGDKVVGEIELYKKYKFELPPGEWMVADRYSYHFYGATSKGYKLLKIKNKKAIEGFSIGELDIGSRFQGDFNNIIYSIVFKNKYDGCYERPEYFVLEFYAKGITHNCLWISHYDVYKELFDPDDPELRGVNAQYKAWLRDNKIELPKVAIGSSHSYFSRLTGGKWFVMSHDFDPEILGAPKSKFIKEDRSEYHKYNISNFPEHKKVMEKIISRGAKRHKLFEQEVRAKEHHKIDLTSYIKASLDISETNNDSDLYDQIKKLNDLYKSGALSEEEFKKAKEKILN